MNFQKIQNYMDRVLVKEKGVPSVTVSVMRDHKLLYQGFAGKAAENNRYFLYSCTKPVTVAVILRLIEEGRLSLQEPVAQYLPAYSMLFWEKDGCRIPVKTPVTIYHLLTMSAGFDYSLITDPAKNRALIDKVGANATTMEVVNGFAEFPLQFQPGERFCYSVCHDILAAVAEAVTDMPFSEYVKKVLFDPLGMMHTTYSHTPEVLEQLSPQYLYWEGKLTQIETVNQHVLTPNYHSGGAGIISTVEDYSLFADMLACGGIAANGYRFLKPETAALLQKSEFPYDGPAGYRYGLGVRVSPKGEFGWDGAAGSCVMIDPKNRISVFTAMHLLNWPSLIPDAHFRIYEAL